MIKQYDFPTSPFGLKPIKSWIAAPFSSTTVELIIPDTDAVPLYINDVVKTVENTDTEGDQFGIEYCTKAEPGDALRGIIVGFKVIHEDENFVYRKASTRRVARVCQDPFLICHARINAAISVTDVGKFLSIDSATGNNSTGISQLQLDYATLSTDVGQFRIIKILDIINTDTEKYSLVECIIQGHEFFEATGSITGDLWTRVGTTLYTTNAGDNVTIDGKLTVAGLIDPTGLVLTPQASEPSLDNGLSYYDSAEGFKFRENDNWSKLTFTGTTNTTLGGIPSGTIFDKEPISNIIQSLLIAYLYPAFTSFTISGFTSPVEVGTHLVGAGSFLWSTSNSSNVVANSIEISKITGGTVVILTGLPNSGSAAYTFPDTVYNQQSSFTWRIAGQNTQLGTFTRDYTLPWYWRSYYGISTNPSLTEAQIEALSNSFLAGTSAGTYNFVTGGYKYICIPVDVSLPQPDKFVDSSTGIDVAMELPVDVPFTNSLGVAGTFRVWRTTNIINSPLTIIVTV